jgi:transposase-like protein
MNPPHVVVAGTRRAWSAEEKRAILEEAPDTTTSVSAVARRHGLHASLLFRWLRDARDADLRPAPMGTGIVACATIHVAVSKALRSLGYASTTGCLPRSMPSVGSIQGNCRSWMPALS